MFRPNGFQASNAGEFETNRAIVKKAQPKVPKLQLKTIGAPAELALKPDGTPAELSPALPKMPISSTTYPCRELTPRTVNRISEEMAERRRLEKIALEVWPSFLLTEISCLFRALLARICFWSFPALASLHRSLR